MKRNKSVVQGNYSLFGRQLLFDFVIEVRADWSRAKCVRSFQRFRSVRAAQATVVSLSLYRFYNRNPTISV